MHVHFRDTILLVAFLSLAGCKSDRGKAVTNSLIQEAKQKFAPDRRTVVFDVDGRLEGQRLILTGEVHDATLKGQLMNYLRGTTKYEIVDSVTVLPQTGLGEKTFGVVTVSVANMRSKPGHSAEMASQALLGTPLKVLKKQHGWYYVQTPDQYLGWLDDGFELMDRTGYEAWSQCPKVIVTAEYGFTRQSPEIESQVVSDVVAGDLLGMVGESRGHYKVQYPDGREGFLPKDHAQPYRLWLAGVRETPENVIRTARRFLGVPYLWGGTSAKGFDCSGFTKTVYFLNGVLLPRDASQQVMVGSIIDTGADMGNLNTGDLLFFGSKATPEQEARVTHVAIYLGRKKFIHSSGDVRINSFDPSDPDFSEYRLGTFLHARRIIGAGPKTGIRRLNELPFYRGHEL
ncbi:MAG: Cell wall-associated hydrolase [Bacteroidetes bacterium]|nr:Cell wall-associated hydrolase [Bacteroidota bacterium]